MKRAWYDISWGPEPFEAVLEGTYTTLETRSIPLPARQIPSAPATPPEAFEALQPESPPLQVSSPCSDLNINSNPATSSESEWDPITTKHLARALKVEPAFVPCETFAYSVICKARRQQPITKSQIQELWSLIPKSQLCRDPHNPTGRYVVFGANPRKHDCVTSPTLNLPHSFRMLCTFIRQSHPDFPFSTVSLRFNMFSKPHRDTRNAPNPSYIHSIIPTAGGNLWVADPDGADVMICNEVPVYGRVLDIQAQPQLFDARTTLHGTLKWEGDSRLVLVAFTTLNAVSSPFVLAQLAEFEVFLKQVAQHQPTIQEAFNRRQAPTVQLHHTDDELSDEEDTIEEDEPKDDKSSTALGCPQGPS